MPVVGEQAVLDHVLLVGRVRQGRGADRANRGRREHALHELRPTLRVAYVHGADQDPGHGGHQTRQPRGGQRRLFGLYARRHVNAENGFQVTTCAPVDRRRSIDYRISNELLQTDSVFLRR